jgi:hypothetical protein
MPRARREVLSGTFSFDNNRRFWRSDLPADQSLGERQSTTHRRCLLLMGGNYFQLSLTKVAKIGKNQDSWLILKGVGSERNIEDGIDYPKRAEKESEILSENKTCRRIRT